MNGQVVITQYVRMGIAYVDRTQERKINEAKYKKLESQRPFFSWDNIIDWYSRNQNYIHCEVVFPIDEGGIKQTNNSLAFGVFSDKGVFKMERSFSNPAYSWVYLWVTVDEYFRARNFCENQVGKKYDHESTSWRLVLWPTFIPDKDATERWWCGSFVHAVLQEIGMLKTHRLNTLDVDDIVRLVHNSTRKISAFVPHARMEETKRNFKEKLIG